MTNNEILVADRIRMNIKKSQDKELETFKKVLVELLTEKFTKIDDLFYVKIGETCAFNDDNGNGIIATLPKHHKTYIMDYLVSLGFIVYEIYQRGVGSKIKIQLID